MHLYLKIKFDFWTLVQVQRKMGRVCKENKYSTNCKKTMLEFIFMVTLAVVIKSCGCVTSEYLLDRWVRLLLECEINANLSTFIKLHICLFSLAPIGGGRLISKFPFHALGSINRIFFKLTYPNGNKVAILILNSKMWNNFFGRILPTLIYSSVICLVFVHAPHARI